LITQSRQAKLFLTTRFSPGYGDLPLTFQRDLYRELSLDELGIRITEKCILYPQKTITAVIGVEQ
jgi:cobalamin-dependent methionine synthase I